MADFTISPGKVIWFKNREFRAGQEKALREAGYSDEALRRKHEAGQVAWEGYAPVDAPDDPDAPEAGEPVGFKQGGGWYTALDADGNEVGKVQGKDAFFGQFPSLKPADDAPAEE